MKNLCFVLLLLSKLAFCSDSLKVYVVGDFFKKGEKFKFYNPGREIYKKIHTGGSKAFCFYIVIPDSIKDGDRIPLSCDRKSIVSLRYKDTWLNAYYAKDKKYFILYRDFRVKNRYSFTPIWSNIPYHLIHAGRGIWEGDEIPESAKCKITYH